MQVSALGDDGVQTVRYWLYAPGHRACMWDDFYARGIMGLAWGELGDLRAFASRSDLERQLLQTSSLGVAAPPLRSVLPGDLPGRIRIKVRSDHRVENRAAHLAVGVGLGWCC